MTKKEYLTNALKNGGINGRIYESLKELKMSHGNRYGGILRVSDKPTRSAHKKKFKDQSGVAKLRRCLYGCITTYNVIIAESTEEEAEKILYGFLSNLDRGYYDDDGNWVKVTPVATDWVDEDDSVMKAKVAIQVEVIFEYGIYRDEETGKMPEIEIPVGEEDIDG